MGRFSSTTHVKNTTDRAGFIRALGEVMAKRGFVPCAEDEAAKSYLLAFSEGGWVTFASESDDVPKIAADMNSTSLSVEVVDSDFAILQLHAKDGAESTVVVGDGSGYGVEKAPIMADMWKPLVRNGDIGEFVGAVNQESTFVEDTLCDVAPILGIDAKYIVEGYNELFDLAGSDESVAAFYFKKAGTKDKPLTLNAAFVKVFGEALEPLGFKRLKNIKNKQPYYVRVVNNEILHIITYRQMTSSKMHYKCIEVLGGAVTLYRRNLDFLNYTLNPQDWLSSTDAFFRFCNVDKSVMDSAIQFHCNIWEVPYERAISRVSYSGQDPDPENLYRYAFIRSTGDFMCKDDNSGMLAGMENALNVTKALILATLDKASDLETCADYFFNDVIRARIDLAPLDDFINNERYCMSEGLTLIKANYRNDGEENLKRKIAWRIDHLAPRSTQDQIESVAQGMRDEYKNQTALRFEMLDNPELNKRVLEECERVKARNIEILKSYGLQF